MANLKNMVLEIIDDNDKIDGVVIGKMGWGDYGKEGVPLYDVCPKGELLTWEEAEKYLDYEFRSGGSPKCQAMYVWTTKKIIFVIHHDGHPYLEIIPRNPIDCMPEMPGD